MTMRFLLATAIIASLAAPAFAQDSHVPRYGEEDKEKTPAQKAADKAAADAYKQSLGNIPDKGANDPWGTVRSDTPKAAAAKPAATKATKAKTKTGSADVKPPQ
jgi:hypothetical protein